MFQVLNPLDDLHTYFFGRHHPSFLAKTFSSPEVTSLFSLSCSKRRRLSVPPPYFKMSSDMCPYHSSPHLCKFAACRRSPASRPTHHNASRNRQGPSLTLVVEAIPQISLLVCSVTRPLKSTPPPCFTTPPNSVLFTKNPFPFFFMRRLQGVHSLPEFARKLADAIVCVMNAAAANGGAHFNDFENTASICCDCLSEIAKTCKLGSLNRDCPLAEVRRARCL